MKKAILFDLDGTLWDSSKQVIDSWNKIIETLPDFNRKLTLEDMQSVMGKTMDEIAYACFTTVSKQRALEILEACMDYENKYLEENGGVLFDGLEEVLKTLHKDYFLAIVSNCQKGYIEAFLSYHKLGQYMDDKECYGNTLLPKDGSIKALLDRNGIDEKDALYVGDIEGDYLSATKAGLAFIHASYGYGKVEQANYKITKLNELPEMIKKVFADYE